MAGAVGQALVEQEALECGNARVHGGGGAQAFDDERRDDHVGLVFEKVEAQGAHNLDV